MGTLSVREDSRKDILLMFCAEAEAKVSGKHLRYCKGFQWLGCDGRETEPEGRSGRNAPKKGDRAESQKETAPRD